MEQIGAILEKALLASKPSPLTQHGVNRMPRAKQKVYISITQARKVGFFTARMMVWPFTDEDIEILQIWPYMGCMQPDSELLLTFDWNEAAAFAHRLGFELVRN